MAIMDAIIAQGDHTRGVSAQGLLGGVAAVKNIEGRNKLLGLNQKINQANLDEFNANAGIRESQRTEYLDNQFIKVSDMALTQLEGGDLQGAVQTAQRWKQQLTDIGVTDHRDVDMFLSAAQSQDPQALAQAIRGMQALREHGMKAGVLTAPAAAPESFRVLSAEEATQLGLPADGSYQESSTTGKVSRIGGGGVTVNTGNAVPPGYTANPDGSIEPIKGSAEWYKREQDRIEAEQKAEAAETKAASRTAGIQRAGGTVVQDLGRALELLPKMIPGDGIAGANARLAASKLPGTTEYYINEFMDSAKSNIGLDKLQQMRESSPTGGALGQVPIAQQLRLEKVLGQAEVTMTPQMMADNLHRIQNIYFDIMYGSEAERAVAIEQGKMTQEESDRIQSQYFDLSFDEFGRSKSAEQPAEVFVNPDTGERITWDGQQWVSAQ